MFTRAPKRFVVPPAGGARRQRGAAALILLLMLALGSGSLLMSAYGGSQRAVRERQAMAILAEAQQALIGYAITHGRLPRPALSAASGVELSTPCDSEQRCTGFIPWATLSLPPSYARGQPLRYSVTPAFAADDTPLSMAIATKTISSRSGSQLLYRLGNSSCARAAQCLPAVLIARGKSQGASAGAADDQAANARATLHFIQRPLTDDERVTGAAFDDLVSWVSYTDLRLRMVAAGNWQ